LLYWLDTQAIYHYTKHMAIDYENDPNYEKINEGEYRDLRNDNSILMIDEETSDALRKIFDIPEDVEELKLTKEMLDVLFDKERDV
jgi:hypothetical protein